MRRFHRTALDVIHRYGRPNYGAFDDDTLVGVAATFAAGLYPPPELRTILKFLPGFLLAGPGPIVRGLRWSAIQDKGHPKDEHVYLWFLAVDPKHQRGGVGRALLARVYADATAPAYLTRPTRPTCPTTRATGTRRPATPPVPAALTCGS